MIKQFRIWDAEKERMIYPDSSCSDHYIITLDGRVFNVEDGTQSDNCTVLQFSGVVDRNNVKIYEGDIVEVDLNSECTNARGDVFFSLKGAFNVEFDAIYPALVYRIAEISNLVKVVGNIFQLSNNEQC